MKIIVLAGGLSTERDVSFASGKMVSEALRRKGHQVLLLDIFMGYGRTGDDLTDIFEHSDSGDRTRYCKDQIYAGRPVRLFFWPKCHRTMPDG